MKFVIPKSFMLPGGYKVNVKQLTHEQYTKLDDDSKALFKYDDPNIECNTIYLDKSRTLARRRADYIHEALHACLDWQVKSLGRRDVNPKG